ncbi:TonB-dependent receptor [Sinomicrobium kalidii]|uniref:TonB-dependent receptor n=1 Tax=Sinomicrobium kalidii TaxID=2900738 RepID=UPI001E2E5311|nr:TonB-dependent receptor [Sinomicrobium kalidii]UGU17424.1 TonB-dependent receptor [Sinomicrobium kalidii]
MKKRLLFTLFCHDSFSLTSKNLNVKIALVFFLSGILQITANSGYPQNKLEFSLENVPVKRVLKEIKRQTDYKFFYRNEDINTRKKVSISAHKEEIDTVLHTLFKNTTITYTIIGQQIVLRKRKNNDSSEQEREISGKVTDAGGTPLPGANVLVKGTSIGTQTDFDGNFLLTIPSGENTLVVSYIGFKPQEVDISGKDTVEIALEEAAAQLDDVIVVASRGKPRTSFDSPVPVDNLKPAELQQTGKGVLDQQLMFKVPSYNATQQPISDAAAHFSPADLRGLFPSRTLVLVNGKRKNASALVYSYVTPGRGEVGVDMKAIPSAALERVEVLRDGAAAQYGSDAVAGVINLVLKKKSEPYINTSFSSTTEGDGEQFQIEAGFGVDLLDKGYANFTLNYFDQQKSQRAGTITSVDAEADYWGITDETEYNTDDLADFLNRNPSAGFQVGLPDMTITNFSYNMGYTLDEGTNTEVYSFGTLANRKGSAPQFARTSYWVSGLEQIYPGAEYFLPEMSPQINDYTLSLGLKTTYNGWDFDLSSTLGRNRIDYYITNSFNQSYGASSPSDFFNGAHQFSHVVNNLDIVRTFEDIGIEALTVAFGAEHRTEHFVIEAGEEASYGDGTPDDPDDRTGSESFGGFAPENASNDYRNNLGIYGDISADITESFLIGGAVRYENYSDFGSNVSWKLNSRVKTLNDKLSLRASLSSGFRAPALHQIYYTAMTTTLTEDGVRQNGILNNADPALRALGIPRLEPETSFNIGAGITYRINRKMGITVDAYQIDVDDRIVLSGQVTPTGDPENPIDQTLQSVNVGSAGFFLNAIDTRTRGIDAVFSYDNIVIGSGTLSGSIAANFNKTEVTGTHLPDFIVENDLEDDIFSREDVSRVETWRPRQKIVASGTYEISRFSTTLSFLNYGKVTYRHPSNPEDDATYGGKLLTDLSFTYAFTDKIKLTLGANNLFNVYPDTFADAYEHNGGIPNDRNLDFVGRFKYPWQTTQFGIDGTRIFSRLAIKF